MNSHYTQIITKNLSNNYYRGAYDTVNNICHTSKANIDYERDKKNNLVESDKNVIDEKETLSNEAILVNKDNNKICSMGIDKSNNKEYLVDEYKVKENNLNNQKNNSSLQDEKCFMSVTPSQENCHTEKEDHYASNKQLVPKGVIEEILKVIKNEKGIISLGYSLQLACQRSEIVKDFLKVEK
jgi:hypothetical protein